MTQNRFVLEMLIQLPFEPLKLTACTMFLKRDQQVCYLLHEEPPPFVSFELGCPWYCLVEETTNNWSFLSIPLGLCSCLSYLLFSRMKKESLALSNLRAPASPATSFPSPQALPASTAGQLQHSTAITWDQAAVERPRGERAMRRLIRASFLH